MKVEELLCQREKIKQGNKAVQLILLAACLRLPRPRSHPRSPERAASAAVRLAAGRVSPKSLGAEPPRRSGR